MWVGAQHLPPSESWHHLQHEAEEWEIHFKHCKARGTLSSTVAIKATLSQSSDLPKSNTLFLFLQNSL